MHGYSDYAHSYIIVRLEGRIYKGIIIYMLECRSCNGL